MKASSILLMSLLTAGCASSPEFRKLANDSSTQVASHQAALQRFVAAQQDLNAADAEELAILMHATIDEQARTQTIVSSWRLAGQSDWVSRQAFATQIQAADIVAGLSSQDPAAVSFDDGGAGATLATVKTQLVTLGKKQTTYESLNSVVGVSSSIATAYQKLQQAAAAKTSKATAATKGNAVTPTATGRPVSTAGG